MGRMKKFKYKLLNAPDLNVTYAGFGARTLAACIDLMIIIIVLLILETLLFSFNFTKRDFNYYRLFIGIFTWILYNGLFECSSFQATIGKRILKLKVIDLFGKRMSFLRASIRCISTFISVVPAGLGLWYITTDPKKQGWHDLISGSYVIKS